MISRRWLRVATVATLTLTALALHVPALTQNTPDAAAVLTTRFTCKATVPAVPEDTKAIELWLPIPSDSEWQAVRDLRVESPFPYRVTREPRFGNRMVYLRGASSQNPITITVSFTVTRKAVELLSKSQTAKNPLSGSEKEAERRLLQPDRLVPSEGVTVRSRGR